MLYIKADHLADGIYNIKGGEIFKYKAKGGTVRTYEIGNIVRCKECRWGKPYSEKQLECDALGLGGLKFPNDFCSYGERIEP